MGRGRAASAPDRCRSAWPDLPSLGSRPSTLARARARGAAAVGVALRRMTMPPAPQHQRGALRVGAQVPARSAGRVAGAGEIHPGARCHAGQAHQLAGADHPAIAAVEKLAALASADDEGGMRPSAPARPKAASVRAGPRSYSWAAPWRCEHRLPALRGRSTWARKASRITMVTMRCLHPHAGLIDDDLRMALGAGFHPRPDASQTRASRTASPVARRTISLHPPCNTTTWSAKRSA